MKKRKKLQGPAPMVPNDKASTSIRYADIAYEYTADTISSFSAGVNSVIILSENGMRLTVQAYSPTILRVTYQAPGQQTDEFSYALDPEYRSTEVGLLVEETEKFLSISTSNLSCQVAKSGLLLKFNDPTTGTTFLEDENPLYVRKTVMQGFNQVLLTKKVSKKEVFLGLGDKSGPLNLRGKIYKNWNTDAFAYDELRDPLYRSIPFFYGLKNGYAYGFFLHNTHASYFDFDSKKKGRMHLSAEGGNMDYFVFAGPTLTAVASAYHQLTGTPELPPLWSLGYHQCRWSYFPDWRVKDVAAGFRSHEIPCDAIYLDIDYMDKYRCFTWNKTFFPNLKELVSDLKSQGFHTVVMIDPGISSDEGYFVYEEGLKKNAFCRRPSGEVMVGPVWPQAAVFPDFTDPKVRKWWGGLYKEMYNELGIAGFWNDMNEPAVLKVSNMTLPDEVVHHFEGRGADHREAHNIYGLEMSRATYDGLKKLDSSKRPFVLTRASFSGGQRYAATWTGDNIASWQHLSIANRQCQRLSISGFSLVGSDIGGFVDQPEPELLVRWLQLAVFHPIFRIHSMGNNQDGSAQTDEQAVKKLDAKNRKDREPWSYNTKIIPLNKKAIEFRYKLLPYLYTALWRNSNDGVPVIKSLIFADQENIAFADREQEFLFGEEILVSAITKAKQKTVTMHFPKGTWLDYWTGRAVDGGKKKKVEVKADRLPVHVRAGAILPNYPVQQYVGEKSIEQATLRIYYGNNAEGSLWYEDEGDGYGYKKGIYNLRKFTQVAVEGKVELFQSRSGDFKSECQTLKLKFLGFPFSSTQCTVDGMLIANTIDNNRRFSCVVPADFNHLVLTNF